MTSTPAGLLPPAAWYLGDCAWIVVFAMLVLGHYRVARVYAVLAIVPDLVWLLYGQFTPRVAVTGRPRARPLPEETRAPARAAKDQAAARFGYACTCGWRSLQGAACSSWLATRTRRSSRP